MNDRCPRCNKKSICVADADLCCSNCGLVIDTATPISETSATSKLNLYQLLEVGTKKPNIECAAHIHENKSDVSQISNIAVKLDLPIYASQEIYTIFRKVFKHKQQEKKAYFDQFIENVEFPKLDKPKGCTKAHIAAFATDLTCKKYGIPKSNDEIIEAIKMNFGMKRKFTILKTYSLCAVTAKNLGIECTYDKSNYYMRILLTQLREKIGDGVLYRKIERKAIENLQFITDLRENTRAQRALDLALEGATLNVSI